MSTKILKCDCKHDYQDKKHGPQMRVYNKAGAKGKVMWRCSVCGKTKE